MEYVTTITWLCRWKMRVNRALKLSDFLRVARKTCSLRKVAAGRLISCKQTRCIEQSAAARARRVASCVPRRASAQAHAPHAMQRSACKRRQRCDNSALRFATRRGLHSTPSRSVAQEQSASLAQINQRQTNTLGCPQVGKRSTSTVKC